MPSPDAHRAPHVADPSLVCDGLIGCENIKTRLAEYQAVIEAASRAGRDPVDDLALTFCFQGSPGTGKTTVARRMGMLFESLGVLPSAELSGADPLSHTRVVNVPLICGCGSQALCT